MLTKVEDSFETILDVLSDMKSLAVDARAILDGSNFRKDDTRGSNGSIKGGREIEDRMSAMAYLDRLKELSKEIDEIANDTHYAGRPLLAAASSFSILLNGSSTDTVDVVLEPLSAAELSLARRDIRVSDDEAARATQQNIDNAMTQVQERLNTLGYVKNRLAVTYDNLKTSRGIHGAAVGEVTDLDSAREQLASTKLQIVEDSSLALLAQANATAQSTIHLTSAPDTDEGFFARIYSIDHDRDTAPVTQLRRIMLGQSPERPGYPALAKLDS